VPAISIDTFFACSLMVILVLSAMAGVSKLLYPHLNNADDENSAERYEEISKYLLLNNGRPPDWGQDGQTMPEMFGLAEADSNNPYELDIDKVSRLNSENIYAISYGQIFTVLKMSDVSFRMQIEPVFEVATNLTGTFKETNETVYQFAVSTEKHGIPVPAELKYYVIAENHFEANYGCASNGGIRLNVTISDDVHGPALLIVFARSVCNSKITSFDAYTFAHNSTEPEPRGTFLSISPLNCTLNALWVYPEIALSDAYALTFDYSSTVTQTSSTNRSATYSIPHFLDSSPTLIVVTGLNSTVFFSEWTSYPQIPVQTGADLIGSTTLSNVFAYTYAITINSAIYECTVWLWGPRE
jgi:hypothetical protein